MARSVEDEGRAPGIDGRTIRLGPGWYLCKFRLPTAMPIPLGIARPEHLDLVTWAFAGMSAAASRPTCLLVARPRGREAEAALEGGGALVVATHFRDLHVSSSPARPPDELPPDERAVLARAVLSAVTARTVGPLAALFPLLAPALRAMPLAKDAPELALDPERPGSCSVSGADVPNYLVLDGPAGASCARVGTARLTFAPRPRMDLDLDPVWGPAPDRGPERAYLVGTGRFTPARLRAGA
ncbi:hypothetical protein [uncultured Methylobacterium sp.]|uniref:hypothetical protein n=1 Tax=uncultured Methylobacterium sp. TaxID=157278 RepID=UPI0035CB99EB